MWWIYQKLPNTLPLGLLARSYDLQGAQLVWPDQVATARETRGSLCVTVPVIIIIFFAQKYFIQGVTLTGMKG